MKEIKEAIAEMRKDKTRNFVQSVDLIITLKNIDLKKPENKFSKDIKLPHGRGKDVVVGIISEKSGIGKRDIEGMQRDKKKLREFSKKYDFLLCEPQLMALVGKVLGRYLAPKGKMPKLLPPNRDPNDVIEETKNSVKIRVRDSPAVQIAIGTESMQDEQLEGNAERVIDEVKKLLPGKSQIRSVFIKKTMGKSVGVKI